MNDYSISRRDALNAMCDNCDEMQPSTGVCTHFPCTRYRAVEKLKPAQPERKKGKWILVKGSNGKDYHKCSECLHTQDITGVKNYCAVCGADMVGERDG